MRTSPNSKAKVIKYAGDAVAKKSIAEKIETEKNALEKIKSAMNANARDIWPKDQDFKASKVRVRTVRCRRLMVNKNEALEAAADKVEDDIDPTLWTNPNQRLQLY